MGIKTLQPNTTRDIDNTIVDNRSATTPRGLHIAGSFHRNNIIWGNAELDGTVTINSGDQVQSTIYLTYSAVQDVGGALGSNNIGPWSGSDPVLTDANIGFVTDELTLQSSDGPTYNWGTYLHLDYDPDDPTSPSTSPLVNRAHPAGDVFKNPQDDDEIEQNSARYFRDVDDTVGPLGPEIFSDNREVFRRDIGADEAPTLLDIIVEDEIETNVTNWFDRF